VEAERRAPFEVARAGADAVAARYQPLLTAVVDDPTLSDDEQRRRLSDLRERARVEPDRVRRDHERERARRGGPAPPDAADEEWDALGRAVEAHHAFLVLLSQLPTDGA
jgi:hypothetical protein